MDALTGITSAATQEAMRELADATRYAYHADKEDWAKYIEGSNGG